MNEKHEAVLDRGWSTHMRKMPAQGWYELEARLYDNKGNKHSLRLHIAIEAAQSAKVDLIDASYAEMLEKITAYEEETEVVR